MLKVIGVSKTFTRRKVLDQIDLRFAPAQTHILLGSSGSGKSTLLRILLGLEYPDTGQVILDGTPLTREGQREWVGRIGYVPQEGGLFPHLTAAQNVTLKARTLRWPRARIQKRLEELWAVAGLEEHMLARFPKELSGGQQQRIAIVRAAFLDPQVMLLDEPLGALDPIIRSELQDQLKAIFNRLGKLVILVTHDLGEAAFFGHTITLLHDGHVVQTGDIRDLLERPATPFVRQFIGAQRTLNELRGKE